MDIVNNNISMIRGDSESFPVSATDSLGVVPFVTGDTIYFTVKANINSSVIALTKTITSFVNGEAIIEISHTDTKSLNCGVYKYDVRLLRSDTTVSTIIGASDFTLIKEVSSV